MQKNRPDSILKTCLFFFVVIFLVLSVSLCTADNLIKNGSFENTDSNGMPLDWYTDAYIHDQGYTVFKTVEDPEAPDGNHYVEIRNIALNDARFVQVIPVEPETMYHVTAQVRADSIGDGRGANISIEGLYVFSESLYETSGEWEQIDWYGETGEDQTSITLFVRLGGYSGESTGDACFDNITMEKTDIIPGDLVASSWYILQNSGNQEAEQESEKATTEPNRMLLIFLSILYVIAVILWVRRIKTGSGYNKNYTPYLCLILFASFMLRMILAAFVQGYMVDVNCFLSWGYTMKNNGPLNFYNATNFCDYPPAYTYILGLNSLVSSGIKSFMDPAAHEAVDRIVFRFVPSLADVFICLVLYRFAVRRRSDNKKAFIFTAALSFMPVLVLNSACWGQMDSVLCLVLLLVAVLAIESKWKWALPLYMLAVLIKPQALMLGFLGVTAAIVAVWKDRTVLRDVLWGLLYAVLVLLIVVVPFSIRMGNPFWIVEQYSETLASYPYATVNTANWWYLFNGNWNKVESSASVYAIIGLAILSLGLAVYLYFNNKDKKLGFIEPVMVLCGTVYFIICAFIRASWALVGIGSMALSFLIVLPPFIRKKDISMLSLWGGMLFVLLYVFGVKMHERYIIPAFILLGMAFLTTKNKGILLVLLITSATTFINEGIVLDNSIRLGASLGHLNADTKALAVVLSVINVFAACYGTYIAYRISDDKGDPDHSVLRRLLPVGETQEISYHYDSGLNWKLIDSIALALITLVYSLVSFLTLGSTKAPQNGWTSSSYDEAVVIDLGNHYDDFSMLYFAGISRYDFSVAVSDDDQNWSEEYAAEMSQGQCFRWKYLCDSWINASGTRKYVYTGSLSDRQLLSGRYLRITAHQIGLNLREVILRDKNDVIIPARVIGRTGEEPASPNYSDPNALLDEQDTLEGLPDFLGVGQKTAQPGWYNSTYFDEIYHARTGYEHLHAIAPYETSHPPLGKVLMSWGIAIFGMTPFGWRFAGALAGVLMLPAIYLLAKQLTKRTAAGILACLMMALDCMHLTQTQIATIDSFPVLFIILAYFFMLRFMQRDLVTTPVGKLLPDLAFSGLFMGLSIASKWIGIYAGAGLAILFFTVLIRSMVYVNRQCTKGEVPPENAKVHGKKLFTICLFCIPFFILVPLVIYLLSYIPYFAYDSSIQSFGAYLKRVWQSQLGMFSYHSTPGLGMDHPFYSPWYEWPLMQRPMYYAMKQYLSSYDYSLAIFCFGNPSVWIAGLAGLGIGILLFIKDRRYALEERQNLWHLEGKDGDLSIYFLLIGLAAQFLPWVLVPRGTYIYHYFASIPFLILLFVYVFDRMTRRFPVTRVVLMSVYCLLTLVLFIAFFPYASGIMTPVGWLDFMKQFIHIYY